MKQKAFVLQNKGMNRDLSISKATESSAYENHNIRVLSRDHDTMLSVTNERGNKRVILNGQVSDNLRITEDEELRITEDELFRKVHDTEGQTDESIDFEGILIGWNVLNNTVILFTTEGTIDRIYRIRYEYDINSDTDESSYKEKKVFTPKLMFEGSLGFDLANPIESVVYYETEEIQKIYWVDGKNVLRFMNFAAEPDDTTHLLPWQTSETEYDNTYFDSNRAVNFNVNVTVKKDNSGNTRLNGVAQYLLTYYNKHGQESGYVWISDLVYLSPVASGGAADGTNNNSVTLSISNLDTRFTHFRVYSIIRSSLNGTTTAYIVFDGKTDGRTATVVDNNSHLTAVDASSLLYLGSRHVVASTLTHKDQTLFLGDFTSVDRDYKEVEQFLKSKLINVNGWESECISFVRKSTIPNETGSGNYTYNSQLVNSSSNITSFKGGEKYRFALVFHKKDGTMTDAFWVGDKINHLYPIISDTSITRITAECYLPASVIEMMRENDFMTAQVMIAEATYADRSIKAQGIVCPTVFNVWDRYMNRVYAASSWMMRPKNSEYACRHFEPIHNSTTSTGEIDCNYWETDDDPTPFYTWANYSTKQYGETFDGESEFDYVMIVYRLFYKRTGNNQYYAGATVILVKDLSGSFNAATYTFSGDALNMIQSLGSTGNEQTLTITTGGLKIQVTNTKGYSGTWTDETNHTIDGAWTGLIKELRSKFSFLSSNELVEKPTMKGWCNRLSSEVDPTNDRFFIKGISSEMYSNITAAINDTSESHGISRWISLGIDAPSGSKDDYVPSYRKKHLYFVDENVVTLNSPEIEYEAVSFDKVDGYKFRIVGEIGRAHV